MNAHVPDRGGDLVGAGKPIAAGPRWLARLWAGGRKRLLKRIDAGLERGSVLATLPDGETCMLGGRAPGFDAVVELHAWQALVRLATAGSVGWYQAFEANEWSSPDPVALFALFTDNAAALGDVARARGPWRLATRSLHWLHRNSRKGALRNVHAHYDLGNDFYAAWLGDTMLYSSGLFTPERSGSEVAEQNPDALGQFVTSLDSAQSAKVDAIAARLALEPGQRVLEIGCGWGTLSAYLAATRKVEVDGISLSEEQLRYARTRWTAAGSHEGPTPRFEKRDYREIEGQYDAIVSVEMVEAVGRDYWGEFLDCIARSLKPDGRAVIQYIAMKDELYDSYARSPDFIQTCVFPGGMLIRESTFRAFAEARGLEWSGRHAFGQDYARTLAEWRSRFDRAVEEGRLPKGFDARFVRLWRYYLMYCEGGFLGRGTDVAQVTLAKRGLAS